MRGPMGCIVVGIGAIGVFFFVMMITSCNAYVQEDQRRAAECASLGGQIADTGRYGDTLCVAPDGRIVKVYKYGDF